MAEVPKNLVRYRSENYFGQNNYVGCKLITRMLKLFTAYYRRLSVLYNYYNDPTKLFSDLSS